MFHQLSAFVVTLGLALVSRSVYAAGDDQLAMFERFESRIQSRILRPKRRDQPARDATTKVWRC